MLTKSIWIREQSLNSVSNWEKLLQKLLKCWNRCTKGKHYPIQAFLNRLVCFRDGRKIFDDYVCGYCRLCSVRTLETIDKVHKLMTSDRWWLFQFSPINWSFTRRWFDKFWHKENKIWDVEVIKKMVKPH